MKPRAGVLRSISCVSFEPECFRSNAGRLTFAPPLAIQVPNRKGIGMKLAYVIAPGRGQTNLLLAGVAEALTKRGLSLCGTVQLDTERAEEHHCDMDVLVLPDGPKIRISQFLGAEARGCKLNPEALETAVAATEARLQEGADLLLVNKFGKQEAEGRGFREAVGLALTNDIPAIIGLSEGVRDAFMEFVGEAEALEPNHDTIMAWVESSVTPTSED